MKRTVTSVVQDEVGPSITRTVTVEFPPRPPSLAAGIRERVAVGRGGGGSGRRRRKALVLQVTQGTVYLKELD